MIGRLVGGFVAIIIGVSLVPEISKEVASATMTNMTGSSAWGSTVLSIAPVFFALGVLAVGIGIAYSGLRDSGLFGYSDEYKEDYKKDKKKLGTYEEYVRERLKVERMMKYGWIGRWI